MAHSKVTRKLFADTVAHHEVWPSGARPGTPIGHRLEAPPVVYCHKANRAWFWLKYERDLAIYIIRDDL